METAVIETSPLKLDDLHHIAISVTDVAQSVEWYTSHFQCRIAYQDGTWALLKFGNLSLALVIPEQHPPHIAFTSDRAGEHGTLKTHRDGTRSCYIQDPSGNSIELMDPTSL
ncbi:VOC family protein [Planctopirus hydrillae]|uniref:Glyoxalase n=1 Tax=Planctopirus hydrillae TaxID=1841610 RepID=A0A1C3E728_9PLAN|nr:VOC family protein [Planctopirus hydrillae]ODA29046.1 glyoxalase [Planctopirus hydrillae]